MWVFGYGSLMWKVDFPIQGKLAGYITGYSRRFWQGSEDHRGVPGQPGRVVTLVHSDDPHERVCGLAYRVATEEATRVQAHLDYREKDGYEKRVALFHPFDHSLAPFELLVYVGSERNPFFLGPASAEQMAAQIVRARGPSGANLDYFLRLVDTLRRIAPLEKDQHLREIELAITKLCAQQRRLDDGGGGCTERILD